MIHRLCYKVCKNCHQSTIFAQSSLNSRNLTKDTLQSVISQKLLRSHDQSFCRFRPRLNSPTVMVSGIPSLQEPQPATVVRKINPSAEMNHLRSDDLWCPPTASSCHKHQLATGIYFEDTRGEASELPSCERRKRPRLLPWSSVALWCAGYLSFSFTSFGPFAPTVVSHRYWCPS